MLKINEEKVKHLNNNINNMVEKYNIPLEQLLMLTLDYLNNPNKKRNLDKLIKKETETNEVNFLLSIRNLMK